MKNAENYFLIFLSLVLIGIFCFTLSLFIESYTEYDYSYDELSREKLTFISYEEVSLSKGGRLYKLYFAEYTKPLVVNNIAAKKLDKKALMNLEANQILEVYFTNEASKDICEINVDAQTLLSLSDYNRVMQNNQTLGIILFPSILLAVLGSLAYSLSKLKLDNQQKEYHRIKLVSSIDGNEIRVCESLRLCTLTVNGKIIDQCRRPIGRTSKQTAYRLKGTFKSEGKQIAVEAEEKGSFLLLYCDGKLIKRRYTGFDL